jgi:hypothetical protein
VARFGEIERVTAQDNNAKNQSRLLPGASGTLRHRLALSGLSLADVDLAALATRFLSI